MGNETFYCDCPRVLVCGVNCDILCDFDGQIILLTNTDQKVSYAFAN